MRARLVIACLAALAVALPAAAGGQEPAASPAAKRFVSHLAVLVGNVDVLVLDRDGKPVNGLERGDFAVSLDGSPVGITNFATAPLAPTAAVPDATANAATPAETPAPAVPPEPRLLVFYVDADNLAASHRNTVLRKAAAFVRRELAPPDRAFVAVHSGTLRATTPLTSDPEVIAAALEADTKSLTGGTAQLAQRRLAESQLHDIANEFDQAVTRIDRARAIARNLAEQRESQVNLAVKALESLIRQLAGVNGRKVVVYISDGLPLKPGLETFWLLTQLFPVVISETGMTNFDESGRFAELVRYATAAGVALCTIDARGLDLRSGNEAEQQHSTSSEVFQVELQNNQDPLAYMARGTGGLAVMNTNDFEKAFTRIGAALDATYSLGFHIEPSGADTAHKVTVKLTRELPYRLHYRNVLIERSPETTVADRTVAGLAFELPDNPLGVTVQAGRPLPAGKNRFTVPLVVRLAASALALTPEGDAATGEVELFRVAADETGHQSELARSHHEIRVPVDKANALLAFQTEVEVGPGKWTISVGVLDQVGGQPGYAAIRGSTSPQ